MSDESTLPIGRVQAWVMAARPKTLIAAVAPVVAGTGLAAHDGVLVVLPAAAALLGAILIQIGTNFANDYYDFVRGGDTEERVGPTRVTQAGIIDPPAVKRGVFAVLGAAILVGVYLVAVAGWPIVVIGLASVVCAVAYTGGPFPLAYHGLGDVFVFLFFGLIAVGGTYFVQALTWPLDALLAGAGLGALSTAILVVNNLRDIETDERAGKRTLAVRLGKSGTCAELVALITLGAMVPVLGWRVFGWPVASLAALIAIPLAISPVRTAFRYEHPSELIPALGATARVVVVYGVALGAGLALG